ncbi:enoyl-[acyl-carrier-protein] reductase, mitochondrial-like [Haliotis rubra]|uniref:enoyl-[acyl-carrier-protein] reductase, mitochondrial-like n=1 Tax=Haliotis rubra TaxID=36100 RepID=UPI001EE53BF0|nr:enoyl-[acyl-carrier-protein] reductase, mitochondrial-like [Haliotis rubra]
MASLVRSWKPLWNKLVSQWPGHQLQTANTIRLQRCASSLTSHQIIYNKFGDPRQVLEKTEVHLQTSIQKDEVLIKMLMAPVNPSDINMIEGTYFIRPPLPAVVGNEGVGEIIGKGEAVSDLSIGDWVIPADSGWGTWRSYAVAPRSTVFKVANDIPVDSAATLLVNPPTAYRMLKDYVDLNPGDIVIQNGANSAVGQCVIQLAKHWNITTINMVRDRPDIDQLIHYLKDLGADHVVTEKFCRSPEMKDFMKSLPSQPKLGLNCVGGSSSTEMLRYLGQGAKMITYGGMSRKPIVVPTGALLFKEIKLEGYWNTEWNKRNRDSHVRDEMYQDLCQLIRDKHFKNPVSDNIPLELYDRAVTESLESFKGTKKILVMDKNLL